MSRIIARFSSRVVRSALTTWRGSALATRVTTPAPDSRSAATWGSSAATAPALRVEPNAASRACLRSSSVRALAKNSVSFGTAPGQPPSMKPDAELVEVTGDDQLVLHRQGEPHALGTVAQSGVVDVEVVRYGGERGAGHNTCLSGLAEAAGQTKRPLVGTRGLRVGGARRS